MNADFIEALNALEKEKGISKDVLLSAVESALIFAYKRNYNSQGNVRAEIDGTTGEIHIYASKTVVEEVFDPTVEGGGGFRSHRGDLFGRRQEGQRPV